MSQHDDLVRDLSEFPDEPLCAKAAAAIASLQAENDRLTAAVLTARREALEEACEAIRVVANDWQDAGFNTQKVAACDYLITHIRFLAASPVPPEPVRPPEPEPTEAMEEAGIRAMLDWPAFKKWIEAEGMQHQIPPEPFSHVYRAMRAAVRRRPLNEAERQSLIEATIEAEREEALAVTYAGWRMVPVEPTPEMWAAMGNAAVPYSSVHHDVIAEAIWRAAMAAAPSSPAIPERG